MEKRDYLEELIVANRTRLDDAEPPEGHFDRFRKRLEKEEYHRSFSWNSVWKVAAAVVFIFLAVNQARIWMKPAEAGTVALSSISPELAEVEFYYIHAINTGMNSLAQLAGSGVITEKENEIMLQEFAEFEKRYEALQEELNAHPHDERIINAMIEYYQARLNVISMVLQKLEEVKQTNNRSHAKEV